MLEIAMLLTDKQTGVLKGMLAGASLVLAAMLLSILLNPFGYPESLSVIDKLSVAIKSAVIPMTVLAICIARMARHRFFTPDDIDGVGLSPNTSQAKLLQAILQNTTEQTLLALPLYLACAVIIPSVWLSVVPITAILFGLGRAMFILGYKNGASTRALGFALTFYPSVIMMILIFGTFYGQFIS